MADDIRTRIKQAIDQAHKSTHPHSTYDDWLGFAADAVIRELESIPFTDQRDRSGVRYPLSDYWTSSDCPDYLKKWIAAVDD